MALIQLFIELECIYLIGLCNHTVASFANGDTEQDSVLNPIAISVSNLTGDPWQSPTVLLLPLLCFSCLF